MGKLNLLHHKSYHPYKADNVARVERDEAKARAEEEEVDRRSTLADSEARIDRMRKKNRKGKVGVDEGEKLLEWQLKGLGEEEVREGGSRIVRVDKGKGKGKELLPSAPAAGMEVGGHINFWSEMETGGQIGGVNVEAALEKALQKEQEESITKVYLAKRGEGDQKGWYASQDGKTERERKEGVEGGLERAYKDGEAKRLSDPMALMNSFLQRREDVLSGAPIRRPPPSIGRERYPTATPLSDHSDLSPIITSLLAPRRRKGDPIPAPPLPKPTPTPYRSSSTKDPASEAASRVSNERARAAALIASRRTASGSSVASETPRSDAGMGGFGMFNRDETREAKERRGGWGRSGGGWEEQKRRRDERERGRPY